MTQEQKAKAYDEAKARMSRAWNDNRCTLGFMNEIFPELKESENWIPKEIIKYLKEKGDFRSCWIAWLEKQGEKPTDKIQLGKKYKCIASPRYSTFMIGKTYKPEDKFLCSLMNFCSDCFEPIEDGEQKPADNIEKPWSEEDNEHLERILKELENQWQRPSNRPYLDEIVSDYYWLKSLKDRVQPKQEYVEQQVKYRKL